MTIRPLRCDEIASLVHLCGEHAAYEKADYAPEGKSEPLRRAIAAEPPRLWCLVAEIDSRIVGYATCTRDFSTWRAAEYLYLDCLYIIPELRTRNWGQNDAGSPQVRHIPRLRDGRMANASMECECHSLLREAGSRLQREDPIPLGVSILRQNGPLKGALSRPKVKITTSRRVTLTADFF